MTNLNMKLFLVLFLLVLFGFGCGKTEPAFNRPPAVQTPTNALPGIDTQTNPLQDQSVTSAQLPPTQAQEKIPSSAELMVQFESCTDKKDEVCLETLLRRYTCTDFGGNTDFLNRCYSSAPWQMKGMDCMSEFFITQAGGASLICPLVNRDKKFNCDYEWLGEYTRPICKRHNAFVDGDISWCKDLLLLDGNLSDCYGAVAANKNDSSICFSSNLMDDRGLNKRWSNCLSSMAKYSTNPELCSIFINLPRFSEVNSDSESFLRDCQTRTNSYIKILEGIK